MAGGDQVALTGAKHHANPRKSPRNVGMAHFETDLTMSRVLSEIEFLDDTR
jgi:hypothetical protein